MKRIDSCTIWAKFKVWIYQNYFVPSKHFFLCVSDITPSQLASVQRQITRFLKSWLNLPRCATLASIFHPKSLGFKHFLNSVNWHSSLLCKPWRPPLTLRFKTFNQFLHVFPSSPQPVFRPYKRPEILCHPTPSTAMNTVTGKARKIY